MNISPTSPWSSFKTKITTTLLGWIPLLPGWGIRYLLYPLIFKKMGRSVKIYPGVKLTDGGLIEIDNGVVLSRGVDLNIEPTGKVKIGSKVFLKKYVHITCEGTGGKIELRELSCLDRGVDLKTHNRGQIEIGKGTYVGPYTCIAGYGKIEIGKDCLIASHSSIYAHNHAFDDLTTTIKDQGFTVEGIVIEDNCWLGSGVRVVDGVKIGRGSVIGAGAVVTKDIPPYSVAVGVPAKVISTRKQSARHPKPSRYISSH